MQQAGKAINQCITDVIRGVLQSQLARSQLPAASVDNHKPIDHLTKLIESIANQTAEQAKNSFWRRLIRSLLLTNKNLKTNPYG